IPMQANTMRKTAVTFCYSSLLRHSTVHLFSSAIFAHFLGVCVGQSNLVRIKKQSSLPLLFFFPSTLTHTLLSKRKRALSFSHTHTHDENTSIHPSHHHFFRFLLDYSTTVHGIHYYRRFLLPLTIKRAKRSEYFVLFSLRFSLHPCRHFRKA